MGSRLTIGKENMRGKGAWGAKGWEQVSFRKVSFGT
jgi:hypothetical protein